MSDTQQWLDSLGLGQYAEAFEPYFLASLAEGYGARGQTAEALDVISKALRVVDQTAGRWWEAELYRLRGELLLSAPGDDSTAVENCFEKALMVARHQEAKALELRAAISLARVWKQAGRCEEARDLLAPTYGWFTEGFDTTDLKEAKLILEELS